MKTIRNLNRATSAGLLCLLLCLSSASWTIAQEERESVTSEIRTTVDADIPAASLRVRLRPMTREQLEQELAGWLGLLRAKITEVGEAELKLQDLREKEGAEESGAGQREELEKELADLRVRELELIGRTKIVLDGLRSKGGDVAAAEQYLAAVGDLDSSIDSDSRLAAVSAALKAWAASEEGGKLFVKRIIFALLIVAVAWFLSRYAGRAAGKALGRQKQVSTLLTNFVRKMAGGLILVIGFLMALSALGVSIGPMMAALGAGGFIIGFALQETLGSFAAGLMIMIYRPFDVDDYVSVAGVEGKVEQMSLVSTTLLTLDNKVLVIPNKTVWGGTITNFTGRKTRRVDLVFGIGYGDDIPKAIGVLKEIATSDDRVLQDPGISVEVVELGDSSVNLACRPWVKTADYWPVFWELTREVKMRFDREGISIPFPQRDVHMVGSE